MIRCVASGGQEPINCAIKAVVSIFSIYGVEQHPKWILGRFALAQY